MLIVGAAATTVLAQFPGGGQGEDFGKSSPVGLFLLIAFGIAVAFLIRSMTKHLKKLPTSFDEQKAADAAPAHVKRAEEQAAARAEAEAAEAGDESAEPAKGSDTSTA
ncbi:hypothetical protein GIY23_03835 [Allosaccharopolyspora coralli]|uniref:Uncharacterized protein n=1 Tax=Allosaccharopolyspora coralli TaxID=2665642 RepID=A0A5Q3Q6J5_9PSEU|nr:hypothetical protein [Allosaccharopolyspora coralli]QGK68794.1 hypothetical protein GIY23_03835 [Allosaccharopolyspora coralli]